MNDAAFSWVAACTAISCAVGIVGILWFLQGSDLVHIDPIACVGECEPVTGHHPEWQVAGAAVALVGVLAATVAVRKLRT